MNSDDCIFIFESPIGVIAMSVDAVHAARFDAEALLGTSTSPEKNGVKDHTVPLMDAGSIATLFGMDAAWFRTRARENRIPHIRIGKYVRFDPVEVRDYFHHEADRHANSEETHPQQHADSKG